MVSQNYYTVNRWESLINFTLHDFNQHTYFTSKSETKDDFLSPFDESQI